MKCKQHSPKLEWYGFSCVPFYIDFDTFELLSADRYVLRAQEGFADPLSILSFYWDDSKQGNKCVPNILWLNNITINVKIVKAVI